MRRTDKFIAALALVGMATAIPGMAIAAKSAQGSGSGGRDAPICRVDVNRNASSGVFDVTRRVDGDRCVCIVSTGPSSQGGSAEAALAALRLRGSCADAPLVADAATGGGLSTGAVVGIAVVATGGIIAALVTGGSSSP